MGRITTLYIILLASALVFSSLGSKVFAWSCAFDDPTNQSKCPYLRPSIDTVRTFAIYYTSHLAANTLLSYWTIVSARSRTISPQA